MAKYVDVLIVAYAANKKTIAWMNDYWPTVLGQPAPIVLELQPVDTHGAIPASGHFSAAVKNVQQANGGKFVEPFIRSRLINKAVNVLKIPKGCTIGRIGVVGFSAGGGAVSAMLASEADRKVIDFAYYCDGMHASWDPRQVQTIDKGTTPKTFAYSSPTVTQFSDRLDGSLVQDLIDPSSLQGQKAFALEAAKGNVCMVVTHSQVVPDGPTFPSTTEAATNLIGMVKQEIGDFKPEGAIYPAALFVEDSAKDNWPTGDKSDDQGTYWEESYPAWQGCAHKAMFRAPYPVTRHEAMGNFIVVGVGVTDQYPGTSCSRSVISSGPAHEFQADTMQFEVMRLVLAERWKQECAKGALEGPEAFGAAAAALVAVKRGATGTLMKRNPRRLVAVGLYGLGQDDTEACVMEGIFANLFGLDEIERAKVLAKVKIVGLCLLLGVVGTVAVKKATED